MRVTADKPVFTSCLRQAASEQIRYIFVEFIDLIASAGISYNKFLAKQASDHYKPDGLYLRPPEQ